MFQPGIGLIERGGGEFVVMTITTGLVVATALLEGVLGSRLGSSWRRCGCRGPPSSTEWRATPPSWS